MSASVPERSGLRKGLVRSGRLSSGLSGFGRVQVYDGFIFTTKFFHRAGSEMDRANFYERMAGVDDWDRWTNSFETRRRLDVVFGSLLAGEDLSARRLLDAGSGGGHFSAEACQRGAVVTSLDVGDNLLAQVAARCESTRVRGSVLSLPFNDEAFDVVLSSEVIEHTVDPIRALRELSRVLVPGGLLVLTTPSRLWQPVVRLASALKLRSYQGYENFISPHRARVTLERSGVQIDRCFGFNLLPLFHRRFMRFHGLADRAGARIPGAYVNFAIRGRKAPRR